ncbi:MAG TPA: hypothetical protein V6C88_11385 [Chroococcidiopsis sp.]
MTTLNPSTLRRLKKLRQIPSVWEGDRRVITPGFPDSHDSDPDAKGECIIWVDGTEGIVRAMDLVSSDMGPEAVVRTLLRAMEHPHSATIPARPQKIVVCNREIQFFLRGVLQDLGIVVDYDPVLPLIEEIFRGLQEVAGNRPPQLPEGQAEALHQVAAQLWQDAPWEHLNEEKIITVALNYGDVDTLYVSILGMLGMEYGILMYRSLESLKTFRQRVLAADDSPEQLEEAFLEQDCFFVTFDQDDEAEDFDEAIAADGVLPSFGNLHPLEGMRPMLDEEEAIAVWLALTALHRFFQANLKALSGEQFPAISSNYRLPNPKDGKKKVAVTVSTQPELSQELEAMASEMEGLDSEGWNSSFPFPPTLRDDLIPHEAFYSLGALPWETLTMLRSTIKIHHEAEAEFPMTGDGFPVLLIQTSRPKALELISKLDAVGGAAAICFNPGEDPLANIRYDLGILQAGNGEMFLFGEFQEEDPVHVQARKKWDQRCKKTKGHCGLVIAKGFKGANRGNPNLGDMMALFEVRSLSSSDLGLGPLELVPKFY